MDLKQFITGTIDGIFQGVREAQTELDGKGGGKICPNVRNSKNGEYADNYGTTVPQYIDFDIAVTVSKKSKSQGGLGISIANIGIGGKKSAGNENVSVNKIKFSLPVIFPFQKNDIDQKN